MQKQRGNATASLKGLQNECMTHSIRVAQSKCLSFRMKLDCTPIAKFGQVLSHYSQNRICVVMYLSKIL